MTKKSAFWSGFAIEVFLIAAVSVSSISMRQFLEPFHRGFFKTDESLMHPFKPSSVTSVMLYLVGFLVPTFSIFIIEFVYVRLSSERQKNWNVNSRNDVMDPLSWRTGLWKCYSTLIPYYFGAAATHALTNLMKYAIGRLRPHFFVVCQPDWSLLNCTTGYITTEICKGTDTARLKEARLSFPSGHSSIAMYCSIFFVLYLYYRFTWKRITLVCPIIQLIVFGAGLYTCLSRISDYKHHWSDVVGGGLLGTIIAVLSIIRIRPVFTSQRHPLKRKRKHEDIEQRISCISENGGRTPIAITAL